MTYASTSIDRRAAYYLRCAQVIAADPLDFYTRAEKGRRWIACRFSPLGHTPEVVVDRYLSGVFGKQWVSSRTTVPSLRS